MLNVMMRCMTPCMTLHFAGVVLVLLCKYYIPLLDIYETTNLARRPALLCPLAASSSLAPLTP